MNKKNFLVVFSFIFLLVMTTVVWGDPSVSWYYPANNEAYFSGTVLGPGQPEEAIVGRASGGSTPVTGSGLDLILCIDTFIKDPYSYCNPPYCMPSAWLENAKASVNALLDVLPGHVTQVGIITFKGSFIFDTYWDNCAIMGLRELAANREALKTAIDSLTVDSLRIGGGGRYGGEAILEARDELLSERAIPGRQKMVLIISEGIAGLSGPGFARHAHDEYGIIFHTAGAGAAMYLIAFHGGGRLYQFPFTA